MNLIDKKQRIRKLLGEEKYKMNHKGFDSYLHQVPITRNEPV